ncbi:aldo/keto reductase [Bradyrhizobium sp. 44]|nr:aldo/keto reductase [Bradyrhizobium sp. 44]
MEQRKLGSTGPTVSALGLGCMGMSEVYGPADRGESIATIHAALDAGITLVDTGDFYAMGHNEMLDMFDVAGLHEIGDAADSLLDRNVGIEPRRAVDVDVVGAEPLQRIGQEVPRCSRPRVHAGEFAGRTAQRTEFDADLHLLARHVLERFALGLSEVGSDTIRRAHAVHPIADLQIEYSLIERGIERDILTTCRELGIGITAYGVLARGLISGHWSKDSGKTGKDYRLMTPRFQGSNLDVNLALVEQLRAIAAEIGATPAQVAIAWVAAQGQEHGQEIVPLVGARTRNRLSEALGAAKVTLTPAHLALLAKAFPPDVAAGTRYAAEQMAHLDSEKPATA